MIIDHSNPYGNYLIVAIAGIARIAKLFFLRYWPSQRSQRSYGIRAKLEKIQPVHGKDTTALEKFADLVRVTVAKIKKITS